MKNISFVPLTEAGHEEFRNDVKRIFSIGVIEAFGEHHDGEEIIPDADIDMSLQNPLCEAFFVYADGVKVGGVCLKIDHTTQENWFDLFYIYPEFHSKGLGLLIWQAIERRYPDTKVWRLITPYFEKRNIHFYVNKCGFKIVEFFNKSHCDPSRPYSDNDFHNEYFVFEKRIE